MNNARALVLAGLALLLAACSGWPGGAGFGLFDSAPATPAIGTVEFDSDPQGADAKTSLGASCQTPCTLEVPATGPFSVTFTLEGYAAQTVPVQIQPGQDTASVKFSPNPAFAQLGPAPGVKKKPAVKPATKPAATDPSTSVR